MPIKSSDYKTAAVKDGELLSLKKSVFDAYGVSELNLGDLSDSGEAIEAIAAVFDLKDFTRFCSQIDPHLVLPEFLDKYLTWLYSAIKDEATSTALAPSTGPIDKDSVTVWTRLPIFSKFLGDGVLFIWDVTELGHVLTGNIIVELRNISSRYETEFLPTITKHISNPPPLLRCGAARGKVFSVGERKDFVGPCINLASRLQKLSSNLPLAFSRRGISPDQCFIPDVKPRILTKRVQVRGMGDDELVCLFKETFERLPAADKAIFSDTK